MSKEAKQIQMVCASELFFDKLNPRLVEFGEFSDERKIINFLWANMAVKDLVMSILANGFFENEAMFAIRDDNGRLVVIEGNRRLAAVKAIIDPSLINNGGMQKYTDKITPELVEDLSNSLPVIIFDSRKDAWQYIGFKHVNGAVKWDSYAKAKYIAMVKNEYGVSLEDIAEQIGDSNKTTIKLYQGLMVLEQADRETEFKTDDVYYSRVYFSHIYTAVCYEGFQKFLGIDASKQEVNPVPKKYLKNLEELMLWILGSKKSDIKPIIRSQNPDLRYLNQVLQSPEALASLRSTRDLDKAFDLSEDAQDVFYQALVDAKMNVEKALSKIGSYELHNADMLKTAKELANSSSSLYTIMLSKLTSD